MIQEKTKKSFFLWPKKMESLSYLCIICRFNFKVKLKTLSQAGRCGFILSENLFQVSQRKDSAYYKYTEQFLLIFSEHRLVVKNSKLFSDCVSDNPCTRKSRNLEPRRYSNFNIKNRLAMVNSFGNVTTRILREFSATIEVNSKTVEQ